ncbi:MAG: thiamine phosphate synthase [Bacteroidales bacterium]|nr:thiamine phosphate synthase [Bacteroidales bacterium]
MMKDIQRKGLSLQFITHCTDRYSYLQSAEMALAGGCKWLQLRMKNSPIEEVRKTAIVVQQLCKQHQSVFILDDNVDLCAEIQADGVHLGKNDMPIRQARAILGENYIIGATCNRYEDIVKAKENGADYVGLGPFRFTTTKTNLSPILGLEGYEGILQQCRQHQINMPIVAIGGILENDISDLFNIGIDGIAVSGLVLQAENPTQQMAHLMLKVYANAVCDGKK